MIVTNNEHDEQEDLGGREVIDIDGRIRWRHRSSYVLPACVDIWYYQCCCMVLSMLLQLVPVSLLLLLATCMIITIAI